MYSLPLALTLAFFGQRGIEQHPLFLSFLFWTYFFMKIVVPRPSTWDPVQHRHRNAGNQAQDATL